MGKQQSHEVEQRFEITQKTHENKSLYQIDLLIDSMGLTIYIPGNPNDGGIEWALNKISSKFDGNIEIEEITEIQQTN